MNALASSFLYGFSPASATCELTDPRPLVLPLNCGRILVKKYRECAIGLAWPGVNLRFWPWFLFWLNTWEKLEVRAQVEGPQVKYICIKGLITSSLLTPPPPSPPLHVWSDDLSTTCCVLLPDHSQTRKGAEAVSACSGLHLREWRCRGL